MYTTYTLRHPVGTSSTLHVHYIYTTPPHRNFKYTTYMYTAYTLRHPIGTSSTLHIHYIYTTQPHRNFKYLSLYYLLLATYYLLPTTYYLLRTTGYKLLTTYYLLLTTHRNFKYLLPADHTAQCDHGAECCGCCGGSFYSTALQVCDTCAPGTSSLAGAEECYMCAAGHYLLNLSTRPSVDACLECPTGGSTPTRIEPFANSLLILRER